MSSIMMAIIITADTCTQMISYNIYHIALLTHPYLAMLNSLSGEVAFVQESS